MLKVGSDSFAIGLKPRNLFDVEVMQFFNLGKRKLRVLLQFTAIVVVPDFCAPMPITQVGFCTDVTGVLSKVGNTGAA